MLGALLGWLFDPSGLTPHGFCLLWQPGLIWTDAAADVVIGVAYFTIPFVLVAFIRRRRDLAFRPLFWLFAAFILLCGITHWLDLLTLWVPAYGAEVVAKAATAIASVITVFMLWRLLPQALALPSARQLLLANDALRKAEDFLARVGHVAGIGGYELDLATGTIYWSEEIRRLRGVSPGYEPTLQDALDFYTPEFRPVVRAAVDRSLAHGGGWDLELQIINAEGRLIWIRNVGSVEFAGGKATRLIGSFQDVDARVRQRIALEEATRRVTLATDAGRIGIWEWDVASGMSVWDSWMHRLYATDPQSEAVPYHVWKRRVHPDDLDTAEQALQETLAGLKPFDVEYRVVWDDGSVHHLRASGSVTRNPAGAPSRIIGVCWDVTEARELAAEVVRQAELQAEAAERERAIFQNSPDMLFVVRVDDAPGGPEFVYETFSPAFERVSGKRQEDMVGLRPDQCLPPEEADFVLRRYRRCVLDRVAIAFEEIYASPTGPRNFEGSVMPVAHPSTGRIVRIVGAVRDVTERRRTEAELRQTQKLEAIGRLSAGVAHDFNNILQSIVGGLEMILEAVDEHTSAHEFADIALNSAMRGASLTHHLLAYARKQMLQPRPVEIAPFLADLQVLLGRTLGPHIAMQGRSDPTLLVLADPGQLQTALLNLAINASHAMPQGGSLRMDARAESSAGGTWVVVTVADTGTGMDATTLAQAVEPFFSTKGLDGTGLGLSMVQGFAEQSGGTFRITSALGQGTTVELRLPQAGGDPRLDASKAPKTRQAAGRILLVDDATDVLVTTSAFLEHAGFAVTRAQSGDEALGLLASGERFDVLISDHAMPGLSGADLIAEARLAWPETRALLITGYGDINHALAHAEQVPVLHKPFKRAELVAAVHQIMAPA